jgi:hypothetical protein
MPEWRTCRALLLSVFVGWPAAQATAAEAVTYSGAAEIYLERNDPQNACAITVALRNDSGARQGEARLSLAWLDRRGKLLGEHRLRMDPTEIGQVTAKNLDLGVTCDRVRRLKIGLARWQLGWDIKATTVVPIAGVEGTEWSLRWDDKLGLFVARPAGD